MPKLTHWAFNAFIYPVLLTVSGKLELCFGIVPFGQDCNVKAERGRLTCSAARAGVDGFIPLVGAGHREGTLVHAVFAAAEHRGARLQGCAAVGVGGTWKIRDRRKRSQSRISRVLRHYLHSKPNLAGLAGRK